MELRENNFLKETPSFKDFEDYLEKRREQSSEDLILLSKNFDIPLDLLEKIRREIREFLFLKKEGKFNLATTFHLFLWEFYQYKLAFEREKILNKNFNEDFFNFFVYYDANNKSIYTLNFGELEISLKEIFNLPIDKKVSSYDFFKKLEEKNNLLNREEEKETVKQNLKKYFNTRGFFKNYTKKEQELIINRIFEGLTKNLLPNYFKFFNEEIGNLDENIKKINLLREKLFLDKNLSKIFKKLEISEDNYKQNNKYRYFIALICIVGGINHFGAEWASKKEDGTIQPGFYNQIRENLNLSKIIEPEPNVFVERYKFTEPLLTALTLSVVFEDKLDSLIKTAAINGLNSFPFTPFDLNLKGIDLEIVEKIRLLDFLKNYEIILKTNLSWDKIRKIFSDNNFFNISDLEEILKEEKKESLSLEEFILSLKQEKFLVWRLVKKYLADFYKKDPVQFLNFFDLDIKNLNLLEKIDFNQKDVKSYGIILPLNLSLNYKEIFDFILLEEN